MPIKEAAKPTLRGAMRSNVWPSSMIYTDGNLPYNNSLRCDKTVNHLAKEYVNASIERIWVVLKRSIYSTYHYISNNQLCRHVDKFEFRLNEGNVDILLMARIDSLCGMSAGKTLPYERLVAE